jgi:lysophospholipase L1-like esterase
MAFIKEGYYQFLVKGGYLKSMTKTILRCIGVLIIMLTFGGGAVALQAAEIAVKDGQKIAFLGDSITANGWSNQTGYVNLTLAGLKANGIRVFAIPAGFGGHKSNQMLERLKRDVLDKKPDWMTLSCGVNDVWQGSQGVPLDQYKINITAIVDSCRAAGVNVVILTATVIGEELDNDYNKKLASYNEFLRSLAKEKKCLLADLNTLFQKRIKIIPKSGRLLTSDGVHMNPAGDKVMAEGILRAFGLNHAQIKKAQDAWMEISGNLNLYTLVEGINENLLTGRHYLPVIFPHHHMVAMKKGTNPFRIEQTFG